MKISVLVENTTSNDKFNAEHGLSLYIETEKHNILFDTGQSDLFVKNADKLGIDLKNVDIAVLSHAHYDHSGGLEDFFKINDKAMLYAQKDIFDKCCHLDGRYIGLNPILKEKYLKRFIFVEDEINIDNELCLFSANKLDKPFGLNTFSLCVEKDGQIIPDDFSHEHYLIINENNSKTLISGCSHKGISNIMYWIKNKDVNTVIGGFHLSNLDPQNIEDKKMLDSIAEILIKAGSTYYTGHCTGLEQALYLKQLLYNRMNLLSTSKCFNI